VSPLRAKPNAGFTLVEVLIGMSLSLLIMGAVLSSYVFLGRNFTRSLGISSANQPNLESQARRTLAYFTQDVRAASGLDLTGTAPKVLPSASGVTLVVPTGSGTTTVTYVYNSAAHTLTRTAEGGPSLILHSSLLSCNFAYYDSTNHPYTNYTDYLASIKQLSLALTAQTGRSTNGTLTQVYQVASPRMVLRNKTLLP